MEYDFLKKERKGHQVGKPFYKNGWFIFIVVIATVCFFDYIYENPSVTVNTIQNVQPIVVPPIKPKENICTKFEYTRWSGCSEKGSQMRLVNSAYPQGCKITDNNVSMQQTCLYKPLNINVADLSIRITQQIKQSANGTIVSEYISGQNNEFISNVRWTVTNDGSLVIWNMLKDRLTTDIIQSAYLKDTTGDFRPDYFSSDGSVWYTIEAQTQSDQLQFVTIWMMEVTYFAEYLLE